VPPTYYVIELSARWLTVLLVVLALVMVLAFAFGYGAAWSVLTERGPDPPEPVAAFAAEGSPTPEIMEEVVLDQPTPTRRPIPARPSTSLSTPITAPSPTPVAVPEATAESSDEFWVQVLASSTSRAIERAREELTDLGFPSDHHRVTTTQVAGGNVLHKLRVGPFPDRESADRVVRRMQSSGYPDAWVVVP
jgi:cell division septation protein DedD